MVEIEIPQQVQQIIDRLAEYQYKAYIVGECVRDLLLGRRVMDYDIITNAMPERLEVILGEFRIIKNNIDKGRLVILVQGMAVEVATYCESMPDIGAPIYTSDIVKDLARREFTMNAMAYSAENGLVDPFGGGNALEGEFPVIKPIEYREQAVLLSVSPKTIFNALMYLGSGQYILSDEAKQIILESCELLGGMDNKTLMKSFSALLMCKRIADVMEELPQVFFAVIPELEAMYQYDQHSRNHVYDLWLHTAKAVGFSTPELNLRYALLLHGIGKPDCEAVHADGRVTFFGHAVRSRLLAERVMDRMGFMPHEIDEIAFLIENQDAEIRMEKAEIKRALSYINPTMLKSLLLFNVANYRAKAPEFEQYAMSCKRMSERIFSINEERTRTVPISLTGKF